MIAIIDYDAGNIKSVEKALLSLGQEVTVTAKQDEILGADKIVLPGVGAFGDAMENLRKRQLDAVIREAVEKEIPFLGICLGLQVLFEQSEEAPGVEGLGILKGKICRIPNAEGLKIPHMGWNSLHLENNGRLFKGIEDDPYVYFVHSYYLKAEDEQIVKASAEYVHHIQRKLSLFAHPLHSYYLKAEDEQIVKASAEYGVHIHASVEQKNVFACQFHPEKSSTAGLRILKNFVEL